MLIWELPGSRCCACLHPCQVSPILAPWIGEYCCCWDCTGVTDRETCVLTCGFIKSHSLIINYEAAWARRESLFVSFFFSLWQLSWVAGAEEIKCKSILWSIWWGLCLLCLFRVAEYKVGFHFEGRNSLWGKCFTSLEIAIFPLKSYLDGNKIWTSLRDTHLKMISFFVFFKLLSFKPVNICVTWSKCGPLLLGLQD